MAQIDTAAAANIKPTLLNAKLKDVSSDRNQTAKITEHIEVVDLSTEEAAHRTRVFAEQLGRELGAIYAGAVLEPGVGAGIGASSRKRKVLGEVNPAGYAASVSA